MKPVPQTSPNSGDDLDGLLRTFFRRQMPHPWPAPPRVASASRASSLGRPLIRSRWALAASLALLLFGALLLPGRFRDERRPESALGGNWISDRSLQRDMNRKHPRKAHDDAGQSTREIGEPDELPDPE